MQINHLDLLEMIVNPRKFPWLARTGANNNIIQYHAKNCESALPAVSLMGNKVQMERFNLLGAAKLSSQCNTY